MQFTRHQIHLLAYAIDEQLNRETAAHDAAVAAGRKPDRSTTRLDSLEQLLGVLLELDDAPCAGCGGRVIGGECHGECPC